MAPRAMILPLLVVKTTAHPIGAAMHAGIHLARYFWLAIVLLFACCIFGYLRHQKVSLEEVASIKYLEPRRVTVDAGVEMGTPNAVDLEAGGS